MFATNLRLLADQFACAHGNLYMETNSGCKREYRLATGKCAQHWYLPVFDHSSSDLLLDM